MTVANLKKVADYFFTFQSGSIQMDPYAILLHIFPALHSNLVLFKFNKLHISVSDIILYIPIWFYSNITDATNIVIEHYAFTFQSGSIQICMTPMEHMFVPSLHSNLVLFKFNSSDCYTYCSDCLYIPIWFYSNYMTSGVIAPLVIFTFQSGSIQIQSE